MLEILPSADHSAQRRNDLLWKETVWRDMLKLTFVMRRGLCTVLAFVLATAACGSNSVPTVGEADGSSVESGDGQGSAAEQDQFLADVRGELGSDLLDQELLKTGTTMCGFADQAGGDASEFSDLFVEWVKSPASFAFEIDETEVVADAAFEHLCPQHSGLTEELLAYTAENTECGRARTSYYTDADDPELPIDDLEVVAAEMLRCEGTDAAINAATDWSIGGSDVPGPFADCLSPFVEAEPEIFLIQRHLATYDTPLPEQYVDVWADAMSKCVPGAYLLEGASSGQLASFDQVEQGCVDDAYAAEPLMKPFFRAMALEQPFDDLDLEAKQRFFRPVYDCSDLAVFVFSPEVADALSIDSNNCVTAVAEDFTWVEDGVSPEEVPDFEQAMFGCLTDEELTLFEE